MHVTSNSVYPEHNEVGEIGMALNFSKLTGKPQVYIALMSFTLVEFKVHVMLMTEGV